MVYWGDRPGYERAWIDWGFGAAILYLLVFGGFVYLMVNKYSPSVDGTEDMDLNKPGQGTKQDKKVDQDADNENVK